MYLVARIWRKYIHTFLVGKDYFIARVIYIIQAEQRFADDEYFSIVDVNFPAKFV